MKYNTSKAFTTIPYLAFFKRGLYWNLFDSLSSQGLVIFFHLLLRTFYGTDLHGRMGCLLSVFYIALVLCNAGLDQSIAPFLEGFTKNRYAFQAFFFRVLLPQVPIILLNLFLLLGVSLFVVPQILFPLNISSAFYFLIGISFILESIRKTCRTFLQLIFYNKLTACVETGNMVIYTSFIVLCHYFEISLSLESLWGAFTFLIAAQTAILAGGIAVFYSKLPHEISSKEPLGLTTRMLTTRLFTWANQSMAQLFSGNLLVPLCALKFGLEYASLMKVMSTISQWVSLISQKTFGISSNALLAHLKSRSLATQQQAFFYLSSLLAQVLCFLGIFLLFNGKKIVLFYVDSASPVSWPLLYFMLINNFLESLFVLYEKWYIFEEEAFYVLLFNALSFTALYIAVSFFTTPFSLALSVLSVRAITLLSITFFSSYRWNIWPSYTPRAITLGISLIISLAFYLFV